MPVFLQQGVFTWFYSARSGFRFVVKCRSIWLLKSTSISRILHASDMHLIDKRQPTYRHCSHSMSMQRSGVRPSVDLSVCLSRRSTAAAACGRFASERPTANSYRSVAAGAAYRWMSRASAPAPSSTCGQRHVESRGWRVSK